MTPEPPLNNPITTTTTASAFCVTVVTSNYLPLRVPVVTPPRRFVPPRRVPRDFPADWYLAIRTAYQEILGDAPPKRLHKERRALMVALRRVLRTTSYVRHQRDR